MVMEDISPDPADGQKDEGLLGQSTKEEKNTEEEDFHTAHQVSDSTELKDT